jgi:hypothetical protein
LSDLSFLQGLGCFERQDRKVYVGVHLFPVGKVVVEFVLLDPLCAGYPQQAWTKSISYVSVCFFVADCGTMSDFVGTERDLGFGYPKSHTQDDDDKCCPWLG